MQRAIELNGVAVENNQNAFALGRLAAADPAACRALLDEPAVDAPVVEPLDALIARGMVHLTGYQNAAWAQRWRALVDEVGVVEVGLPDSADRPLTRAVAMQLLRLMAYKDEYEVARLYTDPNFRRSLDAQFEGDFQLEFHMAPPLLARPKDGQPARKLRLGAWLLPAMRWLAKGKALRGTAFDPFGRTDERRTERALIGRYEARVRALLAALAVDTSPRRRALAVQIASVPHTVRGFGHVKLANLALAQVREAELLHRFDPVGYPQPAGAGMPVAGQFKGIRVESLSG
jgi:indolepyruvate ferredoxin oxidoreductase